MKMHNEDGFLNGLGMDYGNYGQPFCHISYRGEYKTCYDRIKKLFNMCWNGKNFNSSLFDKMMQKSDYKHAMKYLERADKFLEAFREHYYEEKRLEGFLLESGKTKIIS